MYELIIIAVYTLLVLAFVPLERIAKAQTWVRTKIKEIKDKA